MFPIFIWFCEKRWQKYTEELYKKDLHDPDNHDGEDLLEKGMATHSSILAWRISWREDSGGFQFMGLQSVGHYWATNTFTTSLTTITLLATHNREAVFRKLTESSWVSQIQKIRKLSWLLSSTWITHHATSYRMTKYIHLQIKDKMIVWGGL